MASGVLVQLTSKGVQNANLDVEPEASFFKRSYKRHASFAIESVNMNSNGGNTFGQTPMFQIARTGDLLIDVYLVVRIKPVELANPVGSDSVYWTNCLGHAMLNDVNLLGGGSPLEKLDGYWLEILHELNSKTDCNTDILVGRATNSSQLKHWSANGNHYNDKGEKEYKLYVKLPFYFTRAYSQCIPLVALQYHTLEMEVNLKQKEQLLVFTNPNNTTLHAQRNGEVSQMQLMCNVAYLSEQERQYFAANAHQYLITNIQKNSFFKKGAGLDEQQIIVSFQHPILYTVFFVQKESARQSNDWFNWELTDGQGDSHVTHAQLKFGNSNVREHERDDLFFNTLQPSLYWRKTPKRNMYAYSFALYPNAWYPTGTVNASRIEHIEWDVYFKTSDAYGVTSEESKVHIYAEHFNVVVYQAGMVGEMYAN